MEELPHGLRDRLRRHAQEDEVGTAQVVLLGPQRVHAQVARQLHPGEVALVVARAPELLGLLGAAREQGGAKAGALEQQSHRGAERAGTDDGDAAGMLAR